MKSVFRNLAAILAAPILAITLTMSSARAATLDFSFTFTFTNALNDGGTVSGIVRGLSEGTGPATSVEITANSSGFGIGEYAPALINVWTVAGGVVTWASFYSFGGNNTAPRVTTASLYLARNVNVAVASLTNRPDTVFTGVAGVTNAQIGLTITPLDTVAPIPLPATGLLLLAGLVGCGLLRRRTA